MNMENVINYKKASEYWAEIPATLDGVLGGFGFISDIDIDGSKLFLQSLLSSNNAPATGTALDCGAGIGRITKYLLAPTFDTVDAIEPDGKFIETIMNFVGEYKVKIDKLYQTSLQMFVPEKKYDVIWNQWVLGYLKDKDLVSYLLCCRNALSQNGVLIVKENVTSSGKIEEDETDSSITRPLKKYLQIFKQAKLKRIKQCKQTNFPTGIYPVYMFALIPTDSNIETIQTEDTNGQQNR
ncbi:alpha N-terminal protein methyltransferase 1 [Bicyclus anynana]|uniref:Alpha N-terminal protein methyltransferase 1 n=1 Tax=Bicyclus anynana TaxID=110368 RepID=A0A6J1PBL1_BICAN|nr:alpha N-terminal protein methyltransferase 1 [Bicyclus anynana]